VRLLVVDEQESYCELIRKSADIGDMAFEVVCEHAASAAEAIRKIADWEPTVILVDAYLPDMNSLEFLEQCRGTSPLIVASEHISPSTEESVLSRGASAYIPKTQDPDELDIILQKIAWLAAEYSTTH